MRKFTWFILAVQVLFIVWIIAGVNSANPTTDAEKAGAGIGVILIVVVWAFVDIILGVIWLVTNRKPKPEIVYVDRPPVPPAA